MSGMDLTFDRGAGMWLVPYLPNSWAFEDCQQVPL